MWLWRPPFLLLFLFVHISLAEENAHTRHKRQFPSLEDLIHGALQLVRPIFDSTAPLQRDEMIQKQAVPSPDTLRDRSILGAKTLTPLDDVPLCRGNSAICKFISCSAENFKKDPNFSNLNLAAQILGDKKLRQAISNSPEAIDGVCEEQQMGEQECRVFKKGFQLIDRFITTIEKPSESDNSDRRPRTDESSAAKEAREEEKEEEEERAQRGEGEERTDTAERDYPDTAQSTQTVMSDAIQTGPQPPAIRPEVPVRADPTDQQADFVPIDNDKPSSGSHTWSSRPDVPFGREPPGQELPSIRNDLLASFTPPPLTPLRFPTPPSAPPLAFPTLPPIQPMPALVIGIPTLPPFPSIPGLERNSIMFSRDGPVMMLEQTRTTRSAAFDAVAGQEKEEQVEEFDDFGYRRVKRGDDYYDQLSGGSSSSSSGSSSPVHTASSAIAGTDDKKDPVDDYYGDIESQTRRATSSGEETSTKRTIGSGLRNCAEMLLG